jgi:hypothetical protein
MGNKPKNPSGKNEDRLPDPASFDQLVKLSATDAEKAIKKEAKRVGKKKGEKKK